MAFMARAPRTGAEAAAEADRPLPASVPVVISADLESLAAVYGIDAAGLGILAGFAAAHPELHDTMSEQVRAHALTLPVGHATREVFESLPLERMALLSRTVTGSHSESRK